MDIIIEESIFPLTDTVKKNAYSEAIRNKFSDVNENDCIVCNDIQVLAKSHSQLIELIYFLVSKKIKFIVENIELDFTNFSEKSEIEGVINTLNLFKILDHSILSHRAKIAIERAKADRKPIGRPPLKKDNIPQIVMENYELLEQGELTKTDYAKRCNISRPTLNKYLEIMSNKK